MGKKTENCLCIQHKFSLHYKLTFIHFILLLLLYYSICLRNKKSIHYITWSGVCLTCCYNLKKKQKEKKEERNERNMDKDK